jgi:two-component sensor histidine kinase
MFRSISLPVRLAILVAGTTLPLIGFSAAIIYQHYLQDQKEAFDRVTQVTRSIQLVLDREMQGLVSGLTVLANSGSLSQDNFENFRRRAAGYLTEFPDNPSIVIGDKDGRQVFNSAKAPGELLPPRARRPERDAVFRTGKPVFSPLFIGSVTKKPVVTVSVPIFRDGKVIYDLSFNPPLQIFQRIIDQQKPDGDWTISIFDQEGLNIARLPNPNQTIGQRASALLYDVMFSTPEGQIKTISLEGVPLYTAFVRSNLTGWIAAAGIAQTTLSAPALHTFLLTVAIGTVMLTIGLAFAIRMATRIARVEALHSLLIDELNHRVKNTLATVQSVSAQTFRDSSDAEARRKFGARLASLGRTHDILSAKKWDGADIKDVVIGVMAPFEGPNPERIQLSGPSLQLSARCVVMVSMVLHELATNAVKYGALSAPGGTIKINWAGHTDLAEPRAELQWREVGGPAVQEPKQSGFGSTLIQQGFAAQLKGKSTLTFSADGVTCTLEFPLQ